MACRLSLPWVTFMAGMGGVLAGMRGVLAGMRGVLAGMGGVLAGMRGVLAGEFRFATHFAGLVGTGQVWLCLAVLPPALRAWWGRGRCGSALRFCHPLCGLGGDEAGVALPCGFATRFAGLVGTRQV